MHFLLLRCIDRRLACR